MCQAADMATRIEVTKDFVYKLAESTRKERKVLLKNATEEQLKGLFEICLNLQRGNLPMEQVEFRYFKRHKNTINALASKKNNESKRWIFEQCCNVCFATLSSTYSTWYSKQTPMNID